LTGNGALDVIVNRYGLSSKDYAAVTVKGEDVAAVESRLLRENIGAVKVSVEELKGDKGAKLAEELLKVLRQEQRVNETKKDYEERVQKHALASLGLGDEGQ
jgi:ABC-type enterochelin transport system ATPase subunit